MKSSAATATGNSIIVYPARRYTIDEVIAMRQVLPYICCPLGQFEYEAWDCGIIKIYPATQMMRLSGSLLELLLTHRKIYHTVDTQQIHQQLPQPDMKQDLHLRGGTPGEIPVIVLTVALTSPAVDDVGVGEYRRYVSSSMTPQVLPVKDSVSDIDPLCQGNICNMAGFYIRTAATFAASYLPMSAAVVLPRNNGITRKSRDITDCIGSVTLNELAAVAPQCSRIPLVGSGRYPSVTIDGCAQGQPSQGFVPGGNVNSIPVTALTSTGEKIGSNCGNTPPIRAQPVETVQFDPKNWVQQVNRSAFEVFQNASQWTFWGARTGTVSYGMYQDALQLHSKTIHQATLIPFNEVEDSKDKELSLAVAELPQPPPPLMLEYKLAFSYSFKIQS
jgi:hypothetical protein